jgi:hypothetical protein
MGKSKKSSVPKPGRREHAAAPVPPMGPPTNVRPGGAMADRRLKRRRTRGAAEHEAIAEEA